MPSRRSPSRSRTRSRAPSTRIERVEIDYAEVGSSGKVWTSNANGSANVLGFSSAAVAATSTVPASVVAKTGGGKGIAFDKEGNMWALGTTTADPTLVRLPAASLAMSGQKTPDRKIDIKGSGCGPYATSLAFDASGNLWVNAMCEGSVVRLTPADLASDGEKTPGVVLGGMDAPRGVAFDAAGNLWVADDVVRRFDASRLSVSSNDPANASLTIDGNGIEDLAFDATGDLWAAGGSVTNLAHLAKADLAAAGAREVMPLVKISVGVSALPQGIAFDESGGLWLATSHSKIARLAPSQLATPSTYAAPTVPERTITSDDIGSAGSIAIFPAPSGLPLFHSAK
jgi:streptogramin lyase